MPSASVQRGEQREGRPARPAGGRRSEGPGSSMSRLHCSRRSQTRAGGRRGTGWRAPAASRRVPRDLGLATRRAIPAGAASGTTTDSRAHRRARLARVRATGDGGPARPDVIPAAGPRPRRDGAQRAEASERVVEHAFALRRDRVVAARRPLVLVGGAGVLPARSDVAVALEPAERGVDRAAREAGLVDDLEAVGHAGRDGVEDGDGLIAQQAGRMTHTAILDSTVT